MEEKTPRSIIQLGREAGIMLTVKPLIKKRLREYNDISPDMIDSLSVYIAYNNVNEIEHLLDRITSADAVESAKSKLED